MSEHHDPHSEQDALAGEPPGRARNPIVQVYDLVWPLRTADELHAIGLGAQSTLVRSTR